MSAIFRWLLAIILMGFAMSWAIALIMQKQTPTTVDAVLILTPLVLGFAAAVPATFTLVITTVRPFWPFGKRDAQ